MRRCRRCFRYVVSASVAVGFLLLLHPANSWAAVFSETTEECISCHESVTPGIVASWRKSRHAATSPAEALGRPSLERRLSAETVSDELTDAAVGCAECHMLRPQAHEDTFDHLGYEVYVVVSPDDCAVCHPTEAEQYGQNLMAHAHGNLKNNAIYQTLIHAVNGVQSFEDMNTVLHPPDELTGLDACDHCHGSEVKVDGTVSRETALGEMEFPDLTGWPNQGTGRINPDGSMGACSACHTRHEFSIEMARKAHTCSECHKGPDVPAYKVYQVSKHGNIYSALGDNWTWDSVPWVVGKDFTAPTCAACHMSLLVNEQDEVINERTHRMSDRLDWRLFGLIYAHPHPKSPDTTGIRNQAGLPLPTELSGEPATEYVIDEDERYVRRENMQRTCRACHSGGWVEGHFARLDNTIKTTNDMTLTATNILAKAWENGAAEGLPQGGDIFDQAIEKKWVEQWLFYGNSTRFASAMAGADYGVFANGRWYMSKNVQEMLDWLHLHVRGGEAR
jgi:hydroxylamine dehydrogenase